MSEKKLYCVVVTDPAEDVLGCLASPIIFHIKTDEAAAAEAKVIEELTSEDYGYDIEDVTGLDIFVFEVTELDILEG